MKIDEDGECKFAITIRNEAAIVVERLAEVKSEVSKRVSFKDITLSNDHKKAGSRSAEATGEASEHRAQGNAIDAEFTAAELREFLAADYVPIQADPAFKEGLRKKLWTLIQHRPGLGSSSKK